MDTFALPADAAPAPRTLEAPWPALLGTLHASDAAALDALAQRRELPAGASVFRRGDRAPALVALVEGQVACGAWQADRGLQAHHVLHGPSWVSLAAPWVEGRHVSDAQTQADVVLADVPLPGLRAVLAHRPVLSLRLAEAMAREVVRLEARLHELMHKDAGARLAAWLCAQTVERPGHRRPVLQLAERKRDIASQLGMTPETLSRMMRSLSERGLIAVRGYTVQVLDAQALQALATNQA